jgi:uncharacterized protein (DUF1697 family)
VIDACAQTAARASMRAMPRTTSTTCARPVVVLLRGVNVGGHRKVPMADLRETLAAAGCTDVTTYIQSGNAVCRAPRDLDTLESAIEAAIAGTFGFHVDTLVRDAGQWARYVDTASFPDAASARPNLLLLALARRPLLATAGEQLTARCTGAERLALLPDGLWIDYADGVARSKLTPAALDRAAGSPVTARNWRTVLQLHTMLAALA